MTDQTPASMMSDIASDVPWPEPADGETEIILDDMQAADLASWRDGGVTLDDDPRPFPVDEDVHHPWLEGPVVWDHAEDATLPEEKQFAPCDDAVADAPPASELTTSDAVGSTAEAAASEQIVAERVVPVVPEVSDSTAETSAMPNSASSVEPAPSMPDGFALFPDGIYEMPAEDTADPIFVCSPLRVDAIFADQHGKGAGKLISVLNGEGAWIEIPVFNANIHRRPTEVLATLIDHGLDLAADRKSKDRLLALLKVWKPALRLRTVRRMGWVDADHKAFTAGSSPIGRANVLALTPLAGAGSGLVVKGSAEDWKAKVGILCQDNPLMILAVSLAFSGPLLAPLELSGGGLHFRGISSSGKTTLLRLAASVWGGRELITQWRATSNGLEAIAATLNDMLLPLDEIAEIPARTLHEAIYMLANGTGKARMTKDVVLADQARWRLALISSGEVSVEEKLREARLGAMAGHEVRLIDIEADSRTHGAFDNLHGAASAAEFADRVNNALRDHHGAPGHAFVARLISFKSGGFDRVRNVVRDLSRAWLEELPNAADGQTARVATRFATIAVAGNMATGMGLTGWEAQAARVAAKQAFLDWYDRRYGSKREAVESFVKPLQEFLAANLNALPDLAAQPLASVPPPGWRDSTRAYLSPQTWSAIFAGIDGTKAAKALLDMQMLLPGEDGRVMRKAPRAIEGRPRLYTVNTARVMAYKPD